MTTLAEMSARVPFHANLAIRVLSSESGHGEALLPANGHVLNHMATVHAGALFTVADVAAGAAVLPMVWDRDDVAFVARGAEVRYLKPARGPIRATATCAEQGVVAELEGTGKVDVPVAVSLADEAGVEVAALTLRWHLRRS